METLFILAGLATAALLVSLGLTLSGLLPRLAARAAYVLELVLETGRRNGGLNARERAELAARLWVW